MEIGDEPYIRRLQTNPCGIEAPVLLLPCYMRDLLQTNPCGIEASLRVRILTISTVTDEPLWD